MLQYLYFSSHKGDEKKERGYKEGNGWEKSEGKWETGRKIVMNSGEHMRTKVNILHHYLVCQVVFMSCCVILK